MPDSISVTGVVATDPRHLTTNEGLDITSFRLASSQRRFDRARNTWIDTGTNWYTVTAFRQLASNMATSIQKGDRVLAAGRLRIREWQNGEKSGTTIEVEAESVGHDLAWGSSQYRKSAPANGGATSGTASSGGVGEFAPSAGTDPSGYLPSVHSSGGFDTGGSSEVTAGSEHGEEVLT